MPMFKVHYQPDRPVLGEFFDGLVPTVVADAMAIKADFWRYEQEWRSIRPGAAGTVVRFNPAVVTGVVFGANCPRADREWVAQAVAGRSITLFEVRPGRMTFDLDIVPVVGGAPPASP